MDAAHVNRVINRCKNHNIESYNRIFSSAQVMSDLVMCVFEIQMASHVCLPFNWIILISGFRELRSGSCEGWANVQVLNLILFIIKFIAIEIQTYPLHHMISHICIRADWCNERRKTRGYKLNKFNVLTSRRRNVLHTNEPHTATLYFNIHPCHKW